MTKPGLLDRILGSLRRERETFLQVFSPVAAAPASTGSRIVLAGLTFGALTLAAGTALGAILVLLAALGAIYFLMTQVLGVRLDFDPEAFMRQAQQAASGYARN